MEIPLLARPLEAAGVEFETTGEQILQSFAAEKVEPVALSARYKSGLAIVAAFMILLPVVYLALIAVAVRLLYWHATTHWGWFAIREGVRVEVLPWIWWSLLYLAPIGAGAILVFFLVKPLLMIPFIGRGRSRSLRRSGEPLLFDFVERVCQAVESPVPSRIDVFCEANAAASFQWGLLGLFTNRLVLHVGLPLAGSLTLPEFAGLLAHELGHFRQRGGMRLSYVIETINRWFARMVYQRDAWDYLLMQRLIATWKGLPVVLALAVVFVTITRCVLWLLMMAGHCASGFLSRQMEFQADFFQARVGGSAAAETAFRKLSRLVAASEIVLSQLQSFYKQQRLPDDLAKLIQRTASNLPAAAEYQAKTRFASDESHWYDTHPPLGERIAAIRRENAPGMVAAAGSATLLFTDFAALSKTVTWDFYRAVVPDESLLTMMRPAEDFAKTRVADEPLKI